jgi:hypothetical protein
VEQRDPEERKQNKGRLGTSNSQKPTLSLKLQQKHNLVVHLNSIEIIAPRAVLDLMSVSSKPYRETYPTKRNETYVQHRLDRAHQRQQSK